MKNVFFILFLLLVSCKKQETHPYTFYYWKTHLRLNEIEKSELQKATVPFLYTRFFDVDKINGKFQPVGVLTKDAAFQTEKTIVPVVFITNRTFLHIKKEEISFLAERIFTLIKNKTGELQLKPSNEIQIDCDWTAGAKNDYFQFLTELRLKSKSTITSTLRLHQVKDKQEAGIPPVDKVYLMCYSTSSPLEDSGKNSILDVTTLKNYLSHLEEYPIKKMDIALPIYSWGIVTNHLGKHKLINALTKKDLELSGLKKVAENEAEVQTDGFYFGYFLNKGFRIKVEEIPSEHLDEVTRFVSKKIPKYSIVYYQLYSKFAQNQKFNR